MRLLRAPGPHFLVSTPECGAGCVREGRSRECAYRVAWKINPHMRVGAVLPRYAVRQHGALVDLLKRVGAHVSTVPFVHGAYDSVFVKDNALLVDVGDGEGRALLARPRFSERAAEQTPRRRALEARGFAVTTSQSAAFEGGDVVMLPFGQGALLGTGFRSDRSAARELSRFLEAPVHVLELRDPRLYHLDTACAALRDGTVAFCPEAFAPASVRWFQRNVSAESLVRVRYEDACNFALNIIEVGQHAILGGPSHALAAELRARGWRVHMPDLQQFRHAGGSAACLVARVHEKPRVASVSSWATQSSAA